jgi:hypothetical protein
LIDHAVVWAIVRRDVPALRTKVSEVIGERKAVPPGPQANL